MNDQDPISVEVNRVRSLVDQNMRSVAGERLERLLSEHPTDNRVRHLRLHCLEQWSDWQSAYLLYVQLAAESDGDIGSLRRGINVMTASGHLEEALALNERLRAMEPGSHELELGRVDLLERMKRVDEAGAALENAIAGGGEGSPLKQAYLSGRLQTARGLHEEAVATYRDGLARLDLEHVPDSARRLATEVHFALAKACDRTEDYDGAWESSQAAHELDGRTFDPAGLEKQLAEQRRVFSPGNMAGLARADEIEIEPLFILGNPRSGTTLLDQILGMHPSMAAGGELMAGGLVQMAVARVTDSFLPFPRSLVDLRVEDANALGRIYDTCTVGLRDGKRYLSDKTLSMHVHLGMLCLCLPRLRVINLHRHPLDNIVSCYTNNLLISGHTYTNRIEWLAEVWASRREMQRYWPEVLEVPFLELHYEDLVSEQEHQTRRILDFLDVPFDDACLRFHESDRHATTLSQEQVKRKMYSTSKGRWRNYEKHLGPAIDRLGEFL